MCWYILYYREELRQEAKRLKRDLRGVKSNKLSSEEDKAKEGRYRNSFFLVNAFLEQEFQNLIQYYITLWTVEIMIDLSLKKTVPMDALSGDL